MQFHRVPTNVQKHRSIKKIMDVQQSFFFSFFLFLVKHVVQKNSPNLTKGYSQTLEREREREISPHFWVVPCWEVLRRVKLVLHAVRRNSANEMPGQFRSGGVTQIRHCRNATVDPEQPWKEPTRQEKTTESFQIFREHFCCQTCRGKIFLFMPYTKPV